MSPSKKRKLIEIRSRNLKNKEIYTKKILFYINNKLLKIGDNIECIKTLKVNGLPGGFRKGVSYEIYNMTDVLIMLDDENLTYDPWELYIEDMKELFNIITVIEK